MRKVTIIPYVVAALVAGACGDKHSQSSDANAAEVTVSPEVSSVSTPTGPAPAGTVTFDGAQGAYTEKRYDEAVRLFTSYTSEHPDNVWGFYMLGLSAWKTGDRDAAVRAFTQALEKDSTHVKSHLNLSRVLIEQGKAQEALPYVEAALKIDSTSNEIYRVLGRVKGELGDSTGAIEALKRAIVLDERDARSMNKHRSGSVRGRARAPRPGDRDRLDGGGVPYQSGTSPGTHGRPRQSRGGVRGAGADLAVGN